MRGAAVLPPSKLMQFLSNLFSPNDSNATAVTSPFSSYSKSFTFSSPYSYQLNDLILRLDVIDTSATVSVSLSQNGNRITDFNLSSSAFQAGMSNYELMPQSNIVFNPNTIYTINVTGTSNFSNGVLWAADSPNILPTGLGAFGNYYFNGSLSSVDNLFQIDVSVPVSLNVNYGLIPFFFIIFFILRFFKNALL